MRSKRKAEKIVFYCDSEYVKGDECWKKRYEAGSKAGRLVTVAGGKRHSKLLRLMLHGAVRKVTILYHLDRTVMMNVILFA